MVGRFSRGASWTALGLISLGCSEQAESGVDGGQAAAGNGGTMSAAGMNTGGATGGTTAGGTAGAGSDVSGAGGAAVGGIAGNGAAGGSGTAGAGGAGIGGLAGTGGAGTGGLAGAGEAGTGGRAGGAGSGGGGAGGSPPRGCDWENPDGRTVLFDGTTLTGFRNTTTGGAAEWRLVGDGSMEVVPMNPSTNIETTMKFEDLCLHLEYLTPMYASNVTGQQRGNSGIYFKRSYEMQVLDSYGQPPAIDGCGAVYGISPPLVVACNMQLVWNTYEIEFKASRWNESGAKIENAMFVSARLNGALVQRNVELDVSSTTAGQPDARGPQALMLQDHGNAVRFRNIWAKIPRY